MFQACLMHYSKSSVKNQQFDLPLSCVTLKRCFPVGNVVLRTQNVNQMHIRRPGCLLNIFFMFILRVAFRRQYHNPYFIALLQIISTTYFVSTIFLADRNEAFKIVCFKKLLLGKTMQGMYQIIQEMTFWWFFYNLQQINKNFNISFFLHTKRLLKL